MTKFKKGDLIHGRGCESGNRIDIYRVVDVHHNPHNERCDFIFYAEIVIVEDDNHPRIALRGPDPTIHANLAKDLRHLSPMEIIALAGTGIET